MNIYAANTIFLTPLPRTALCTYTDDNLAAGHISLPFACDKKTTFPPHDVRFCDGELLLTKRARAILERMRLEDYSCCAVKLEPLKRPDGLAALLTNKLPFGSLIYRSTAAFEHWKT